MVRTAEVAYLTHRAGDDTTAPGGRPLLATVYLPDGPGPFAGVVSVHGGAWSTGDRLGNANTSEALAQAGFAVMSVDFRMPPEARYPQPVADIHAAIRWFKTHAADYRVDPGRIGGIGYSSGGHQLVLATMRPDDPAYSGVAVEGDADARLRFVILVFAVLDPLARYRSAVGRGLTKLVDRHHAYWADEEEMALGNPTQLLLGGRADHLPPALVIQGVEDENLTPTMAADFVAAYEDAGGRAELQTYADAPHGFIKDRPDSAAARQATTRIVAFARRAAAIEEVE